MELAAHSIRVNGICPTWVTTPMVHDTKKSFGGGLQDTNILKVANALSVRPELAALAKANPMRRPAKTEEVADAIVFLCGPGATYITASEMIVDGGLLVAAPGSWSQTDTDANQVISAEPTVTDAR